MTPIERIEKLVALSQRVERTFLDAITKSGQADDPPAVIFQQVFEFVRKALESANLLLANRRDVESAMTLIRPAFEIASRTLWAARESGGWPRFLAYYANQDRVWAAEARQVPSFQTFADHVAGLVNQCMTALNGLSGTTVTPMPGSFEILLKDIEAQDVADGYVDPTTQQARFQYTNIYRIMCRPAHGNLFSVIEEGLSPDIRHAIVGAGLAVFSLARAAYEVDEEDKRTQTEALGTEIVALVGGIRDLSIDDLPDEEPTQNKVTRD